jgi:hypothetical protein
MPKCRFGKYHELRPVKGTGDHPIEISGQPTLRTPIVLLALLNLAILGARLWPWQNVMNLPGNGSTAFDPAVSLAAYAGLGLWIGSVRTSASRKALFSAGMMGVVAGAVLMGLVLIASRQAAEDTAAPDKLQIGLAVCATLILGAAGWRTAKAGNTMGFSVVCTIWATMVSCLMAVTVILAQVYFRSAPAESADPWKQYQGLAIGTPAMQDLVYSLNAVSGFLLLGPIVGCIAGTIFASFGNPKQA